MRKRIVDGKVLKLLESYLVSGRKLLISEAGPDVEGGSGALNG
jgi:hypothetical protein